MRPWDVDVSWLTVVRIDGFVVRLRVAFDACLKADASAGSHLTTLPTCAIMMGVCLGLDSRLGRVPVKLVLVSNDENVVVIVACILAGVVVSLVFNLVWLLMIARTLLRLRSLRTLLVFWLVKVLSPAVMKVMVSVSWTARFVFRLMGRVALIVQGH